MRVDQDQRFEIGRVGWGESIYILCVSIGDSVVEDLVKKSFLIHIYV